MKNINKIRKILVKMKRGLSFEEFKYYFKRSSCRSRFLKMLKTNNIIFEKQMGETTRDYKLVLKSPIDECIENILNEENNDNTISKKYDFSEILNKMKKTPLTPDEFCAHLNCRKKDYVNIITYLSMKYPIYEEDDERIGYLEII